MPILSGFPYCPHCHTKNVTEKFVVEVKYPSHSSKFEYENRHDAMRAFEVLKLSRVAGAHVCYPKKENV